ncbi:hypothetical protein OG21DRAFT_1521612 [Imleria badia]|nr:hypothetical protein OG21DRAFT_1521612 [Imleria badia]
MSQPEPTINEPIRKMLTTTNRRQTKSTTRKTVMTWLPRIIVTALYIITAILASIFVGSVQYVQYVATWCIIITGLTLLVFEVGKHYARSSFDHAVHAVRLLRVFLAVFNIGAVAAGVLLFPTEARTRLADTSKFVMAFLGLSLLVAVDFTYVEIARNPDEAIDSPGSLSESSYMRTMADTVDEALVAVDNDRKPSPPSPSPSPDANECTEHILSRKREREVSLEPATPKTATSAHAVDVKSPAKKGRVHLDTTLEEDAPDLSQSRSPSRTPSHPHSPALSGSPPHDVKVRQISQGVEDIKWQQSLEDGGPNAQPNITPSQDAGEMQRRIELTQAVLASQSTSGPPSSFASVEDVTEEAEEQDRASSLPHTRRPSDSDGGEPEKGLKRKLADRATSLGPESGPSTLTPAAETVKRPRDDADKDDNPRVSKRPSPPPEQHEESAPAPAPPPETPAPKLGGFMSYASTASPFASVKGQNVFSSAPPNNQKPPTSASTKQISLPLDTTPIHVPFASPFSQSSFAAFASSHTPPQPATPSTATKRTGFEAFAGSTSPFASASPFSPARSKSPLGNNKSSVLGRSKSPTRQTMGLNASAFGSYASVGAHAFSAPHPKRARAGSPDGGSSGSSLERKEESVFGIFGNGEASGSGEEEGDLDRDESDRAPSTFGERLRASKDGEEELSEEEKEKLTEQEGKMLSAYSVITGEEEEETLLQIRGKLYALCPQNQWKERGSGLLKLNVRRADGSGARLVMRKEAVYALLLNVPLFPGMKCFLAQDPRYIRFSVIEENKTVHYNLRASNAKIAQELLDEINANIPP